MKNTYDYEAYSRQLQKSEIGLIEERLKKLISKYWHAKNRCACYTDMYGSYNDSEMVSWACKALELGKKIASLKEQKSI